METFFDPAGIVVIGVSEAAGNLGQNIVGNLKRWEYPGKIVAVGRRGGVVHGVEIVADLDDEARLAGCELAVILTPARTVPGLIRRLGALGIRRAVIETAGFEEFADGESDLQAELVEAARAHGVRFIGPNCVGLMQLDTGTVVPFSYVPRDLVTGDAAIIAQSGGVGVAVMRALGFEGLGSNWMISVGNKLDVDEADLVGFLLGHRGVGRIVCYLESIPRGRALCDAARQSDVPVVIHKANRSAAAAEVARSHTAALANDDRVVDAALAQAGILRAADTRDTVLAAQATRLPLPRGRRVALVSRSGGHAVIAADTCARQGLELPPFREALLDELQAIQPVSVIRRGNPLDTGDIFDFERSADILERILAEEGFDAAIYIQVFNRTNEAEQGRRFLERAAALSRAASKPVALALVSDGEQVGQARRLVDWPLFDTPEDAVRAVALLAGRWEARERGAGPRVAATLTGGSAVAAPTDARVWSLGRSLALVAEAGLPVAPTTPAANDGRPAFPVVAKHDADTAEVVHKAALGLVRVGLDDADALRRAVAAIREAAEEAGLPTGDVLVQPHVTGPEVFLGARRDPSFGPVVLFGCGGSLVEVIDDVVCWPHPFTQAELDHLWRRTRLGRLVRGRLTPAQLGPWLAGLGALLERDPALVEIDVNPLVLTEDGPVAIDARVITRAR